VHATLAVTGEYTPREGDRVLVARSEQDGWVIGVLGALRSVKDQIETEDGVRACVDERRKALQVFDPRGQLLFEHRPEQGFSVVNIPTGDLRLRTESGSIEFESRNDIRFKAGKDFDVRAERGRVEVDDASFRAASLKTAIERVKQVVGVAELTATRIVQRAKNVYRDVAELDQTRAGRLRLIAKESARLVGRRTLLKAEQDVSIKGEKIYLA